MEQAELVTKQGNKGRVLTPKGVALLDKVSKDVFKELVEGDSCTSEIRVMEIVRTEG